jgi:hypothetical protein
MLPEKICGFSARLTSTIATNPITSPATGQIHRERKILPISILSIKKSRHCRFGFHVRIIAEIDLKN